jgi:hypothetical protein
MEKLKDQSIHIGISQNRKFHNGIRGFSNILVQKILNCSKKQFNGYRN